MLMNMWVVVFLSCCLIELYWRRGYFFWLALFSGFNIALSLYISMLIVMGAFIVGSTVALILWHIYIHRPIQGWERDSRLRNPKSYIHQSLILSSPITKGSGKIQLDGSVWFLSCSQDLPAGTRVSVTRTAGVLLHVTPLDTA